MWAVLVALAATACAGDSVEPGGAGAVLEASAGDTVRLGVGQSVRVGEVRVTFRGIGEDSRCPIDALCVWPGSAEALLDLSAGAGAPSRVHLHTLREPGATSFAGYRVKLIDVQPAQQSDRTIPAETYMVRLEVRRN